MANYKYHNEASKAFQFLDEALRPFVKQEMIAVYKENWLNYIATSIKWERDEPIWDTLALLHTMRMRVNWDNVFKMDKLRGPEEMGKISALIDWRHRIQGHSSKPVDKVEAEDAIRSMLHLLKKIGANTEVDEVEQILLSFRPPPPLDTVAITQENSVKIEVPNIPSARVGEDVEAEPQRLETIVSSIAPLPRVVVDTTLAVTPSTVPLPSNADVLRVECIKDTETKWWLLQIYDGDTFIGSYERTGTEEGAREKETEIPCATDELRAAFLKNDSQPFVVRYNGDVIGKEGKKGVKQIKDKETGEILGQVPRKCHRK